MNFPDDVILEHPTRSNEYGDPGKSHDLPERERTKGFLVGVGIVDPRMTVLLPATASPAVGDRLLARGATFNVTSVLEARSTSRTVMWAVGVEEARL